MKELIIWFTCGFAFFWALGLSVHYLQQRHRDVMSAKPQYGDFSPKKIEQDRQKAMDDYRQQMRDLKSQQSSYQSQQQQQKRFMEDQKRQIEDLKRQNKR